VGNYNDVIGKIFALVFHVPKYTERSRAVI